jgi:hypothetical protein
MNPISDEDLVLFHYRDGIDPGRIVEIERALATDAALSARYAELTQALAQVPAAAPEPDVAFEHRLWTALERRMGPAPAPRTGMLDTLRAWFVPARAALAGAFALTLALGIGYYAGRRHAPEQPPAIAAAPNVAVPNGAAPGGSAARVLDAYVVEHLRATEGLLLTASNTDSAAIQSSNSEMAAALVESNRLYALAAERAGNTRLATFLRQLEPVLIELANQTPDTTIGNGEGLRNYLQDTDLLFQVRATQARMERAGRQQT